MRLVAFGLSAVLLSGCSWLGGAFGGHGQSVGKYESAQPGKYASQGYGHAADPCQVPAPNYPVPRGCDPAQVTIGTSGGFPQQPNFGGGYGHTQYAGAGYGSHAADAHAHADHRAKRAPKLRKPRWRGTLSYGAEKSKGGSFLDHNDYNIPYDPTLYNQTVVTPAALPGTANGTQTTDVYVGGPTDPASALPYDRYEGGNTISFDDVYESPTRIALGGEYILNKNTTLFGEVGYSHSAGDRFNGPINVYGQIENTSTEQQLDGTGNPDGSAPTVTTSAVDARLAQFSNLQFGDYNRYDFQIGGRRYFDSLVRGTPKTISPFVGASVGASYYDDITYSYDMNQTNYAASFGGLDGTNPDNVSSTALDTSGTRETIYEGQWIPTGQLSAGIDWQVTSKTSLAFETGVKLEGARDYANGEKGDTNVIVPFTLRGSYNF